MGNLDYGTGDGQEPAGGFCRWLLLEHGVREEGLGSEVVYGGRRNEGCNREDGEGAECDRCGSDGVPVARRKADSLSRVERSGDSGSEHGQLLRRSGGESG